MAKFSLPMSQIKKVVKDDLENATRKLAFQAFSIVIQSSPVATGMFRANWQFGNGSAPDDTVATPDASGESAMKSARQVLSAQLGKKWYLVNNLPYAVRLEYGYSEQAPHGMVRPMLAELKTFLAKQAIKK